MHFNDSTSIINLIVLGIHVFVQLVAAILIYIKHHEPQDRSWKYIFSFFVLSAIASIVEIALVTHQAFVPQSYKLLDPLINIPGFYIFVILFCYVIELIRPHWLNLKRLILILLPSLIAAAGVLFFVAKGDITVLSSMRELEEHIDAPNIIARMVFLGVYIPYAVYLIAVRIRTTANQASKYFDILVSITVCLCLSYVLSRGL